MLSKRVQGRYIKYKRGAGEKQMIVTVNPTAKAFNGDTILLILTNVFLLLPTLLAEPHGCLKFSVGWKRKVKVGCMRLH